MCNPLAIAALAAGAGAQAYGQRQVAKATDSALERGMARQRELQGNINNVVTDGAKRDFDVGNMATAYDTAANERTGTLSDVLQKYGSLTANTGEGGDLLSQSQASQKIKQLETASKLAALMGKAGATGDAGQKRQIAMMGDADIVSGYGQDMNRAQQQTQWDLQKAQSKGDNAKLIGSLLMLGGTMNPTMPSMGASVPKVGGSGAYANSMFGGMA